MKSIYCRLFCLFVVLNLQQISTSELYDFWRFRKSNCKKSKLRWTHLARLFSLRLPYHIQKQCGVPVRCSVETTQTVITCPMLTREILEQGVKYVQS